MLLRQAVGSIVDLCIIAQKRKRSPPLVGTLHSSELVTGELGYRPRYDHPGRGKGREVAMFGHRKRLSV